MSLDQAPIQEIIDANIVPVLIEYLNSNYLKELQFESCWCLTNIATGRTEHIQCITEKGAIPKFIALLDSQYPNLQDQAIWSLGNIAGEGNTYRDLIIDCGILPSLKKLLISAKEVSILKNGSWTANNLAGGKPSPPFETIQIVKRTQKFNL